MVKPREKVISARAGALKLEGEILMRLMRLRFDGMEEELAYVSGVTTSTVPLTEIHDLLTEPNLLLKISPFKETKASMP